MKTKHKVTKWYGWAHVISRQRTVILNIGNWKRNQSAITASSSDLQGFSLSHQVLSTSNIRTRTIYLSALLMDKRSRRCYEDLPASVDAEYEDRFRRQYWSVKTFSGNHFCTEFYLRWQIFDRSRKQTNIENTINCQLITLCCNACYWFGIKVSWNMHVYTSLTGGQLFLMWIQNITAQYDF